jgi:hypothetical protein
VTANALDTLPIVPEPEKPFQPAPFMLVFIPLQAQQAVMPALQTDGLCAGHHQLAEE